MHQSEPLGPLSLKGHTSRALANSPPIKWVMHAHCHVICWTRVIRHLSREYTEDPALPSSSGTAISSGLHSGPEMAERLFV